MQGRYLRRFILVLIFAALAATMVGAGGLAEGASVRANQVPFVGEVTLTATAGTLTGSYTTLKEAFDAINAGTHQGVIAISINADTSEPGSMTLVASGSGTALYSSISIQ